MNTIEELRTALSAPPGQQESGLPDLAAIRRRGRRQRRSRQVVGGLGAMAIAGVAIFGVQAFLGSDPADPAGQAGSAVDSPPKPTPTALSPLAQRVLDEIPGAKQVSAYQVVIPGPDTPADMDQALGSDPQLPDAADQLVTIDAHAYAGVTMYPKGVYPGWLFGAISAAEQAAGDDEGYQVGTFADGIIVDQGQAQLACLTWPKNDACSISFVHQITGDSNPGNTYLDWGMGTDDFLEPGAPMEVFQSDNFSSGQPTKISIAGIDGTDVASVEFVNTDGRAIEGTTLAGTLSPGDTIMWADVPGELARVTAYDAAGDVIENHKLKPCSDPVDCEVR